MENSNQYDKWGNLLEWRYREIYGEERPQINPETQGQEITAIPIRMSSAIVEQIKKIEENKKIMK